MHVYPCRTPNNRRFGTCRLRSRVPLVRALDGLLSRQFTGHPQRVIALDMVHGPLRVRLAVEPARPRPWWRGIILRLWVVLVSSGVSPVLVAWRKIISRYIFRLQDLVTSTLSERRAAATTWVAGRYGTPEINVCRGRKGAPGRIQTCDTGFNSRPMQRLPLGRDCCCRRTAFVCLPISSAIEDSHLFLVTRDE
jgi:hypothetical protein